MMTLRTLAACALAVVLSAPGVSGQDRSKYRDFQLGGDLASVSKGTGVSASLAKMIHQRPEILQDLEWRPSWWITGSTTAQTDPVDKVVFSFYNDQLFRLVIDYARPRTEGLTDRDMIDAVSEAYGPPLLAAVKSTLVSTQLETESGETVARWGAADYAVALYRTSYTSGFRLIVTSPGLDALARAAEAQSVRLDAREAPQRELARQKQEEADARASQEKARATNKAGFRP